MMIYGPNHGFETKRSQQLDWILTALQSIELINQKQQSHDLIVKTAIHYFCSAVRTQYFNQFLIWMIIFRMLRKVRN